MALDLAVNLLAAVIAFSVGLGFRGVLRHWSQRRPAGKAWGLAPGRAQIVVADGPVSSSGALTVHPAEFAAATELSVFLQHTLRVEVNKVSLSSNFSAEGSIEGNLIVIGGPIHNSVHRLLAERIELPYRFVGRDLVRRSDGHRFEPVSSRSGLASVDYGMIVVAVNPFNPRSRVIMLAGCRTFGCLGAARAMLVPFVSRVADVIGPSDSCAVVVRMDVLGEYVGRLEIVDSVSF